MAAMANSFKYFILLLILFYCFKTCTTYDLTYDQSSLDFLESLSEEDLQEYVQQYLESYGHLLTLEMTTESPTNLTIALMRLQNFTGLNQTGVVDKKTLELLATPRCSFTDAQNLIDPNIKWNKKYLTYRVKELTNDLPENETREFLRLSFELYANVSGLWFEEVGADSPADIKIRFTRGNHGDGFPFDQSGGMLAHAFLPSDGRLHFDDAERWQPPTSGYGPSFYQVAAHEIGHVIGLYHSNKRASLMFPYYSNRKPVPSLHRSDIADVQRLYGAKPVCKRSNGQETTPPPAPSGACLPRVDAIVSFQNTTYMFVGSYYWDISSCTPRARSIQSMWQYLPSPINAAVGCYAYRYSANFELQARTRVNYIWKGLPCSVQAGHFSAHENRYYFFKGGRAFIYDGSQKNSVLRFPSLTWENHPHYLSRFDASGPVYKNKKLQGTYIFRRNQYSILNDAVKSFDSVIYDTTDLRPGC